jgi:tetratricopeptide (TPR) repeat protein
MTTAALGLNAEAGDAVIALLASAEGRCDKEPRFSGFRAEALVVAGKPGGEPLAAQVLAKDPKNPNARYAQALLAHRAGHISEALVAVHDALEEGRGAPGHLLAGFIAYQIGNLGFAKAQFQAILEADPDDVIALFNVGLVAQRQNRYGEARESYLKALRLDPKNKDARFNLAVLAHSIGADDEARHDLERLRATNPGDPMIDRLAAILASPAVDAPPSGPAIVGAAPSPSASP